MEAGVERTYLAKMPLKVQGEGRTMIQIDVGDPVPGASEWSQSVKNSYIRGGFIEEVVVTKKKKVSKEGKSTEPEQKDEAPKNPEVKTEPAVSVKTTIGSSAGKKRGRPPKASKSGADKS